ncbi:hypothetical protein [Rhodohalobacter mucosus]|uniref:Uncharacterized protein n=1 Tax=Rhodohalobacter mucosus TaxID=2079485 RepID=A0A316TVP2_9BACT|nr:hypothetical protein [Rhodohalobacter mucosus]PWN06564.1 hypothetical protein DDZ15_08570 [Rhodohalobacter mucosus]
MWNYTKTGNDSFPPSEWVEKLADLLGLSHPHDDETNRLRREGSLIPVRFLHDGKHPNNPNNSV